MTTMTGFESVLVANRGEIARRIFHSCRTLGLGTVAVYSDPDAGSLHAIEADCAVRLTGASATDTYLRADLIVEAARRSGAQAVHPGYGFLAENAAFAQAVIDAGLVWIGPAPKAIESMGDKVEAKRLMAAAGVPVLAELDPAGVGESDLPVIIKASAGGGGRGMRIVRTLAELAGQLEGARSEAELAFGDPTVFCEPYLATGRHLEVQVMADQHGQVWVLGERECSIQRRHQKVIEEAPSPLADRVPGLRERLAEAALAATRAVGYAGAGTVEFVADQDGGFYFLEMNTRLQVEHPVTECTTGLDLVALQLQVAGGMKLNGQPPAPSGHAIEARLYAEDPSRDWQPASGLLHRFELGREHAQFSIPAGGGLRLDSAVASGNQIGVHYDPMLAKLICTGPDRAAVARQLASALAGSRIHGLVTNRDLLVRVLRHPAFLAGELDTGFLQRPGLTEPLADPDAERLSALAAALADAAANRAAAPVLAGLPSGWRNVASQPQRASYQGSTGRHDLEYRWLRAGVQVSGFEDVQVLSVAPDLVLLQIDGVRRPFAVARYLRLVCLDSALGPVSLVPVPRFSDPADAVAAGSLIAPMPGAVIRLGPPVGATVAAGEPLLWIEAMKMEHPILAPAAGVLSQLPVGVGDQVAIGDVLAVVATESAGTIESTGPDQR